MYFTLLVIYIHVHCTLFWHCSTVPGNVTGVMLMCVVDDLERTNQCTVDWDVSDYIWCVTLT